MKLSIVIIALFGNFFNPVELPACCEASRECCTQTDCCILETSETLFEGVQNQPNLDVFLNTYYKTTLPITYSKTLPSYEEFVSHRTLVADKVLLLE